LSVAAAQDTAVVETDAGTVENSKRYEFRKKHDPNGTGKFYMGREIALVMGFQAAEWLEREEREEEERLTELIRQLKLKPGQVVADIGAGSGVITMMMAQQVGETGKVFAVDIQQEMLNLLSGKIEDRGIRNIELVLGTDKSPTLEPDCIDLALMVDVYHEFEYPYETILELSKSLKPGGRVAFVEYRREDPEVPIKLVHKMSVAQIKKEIGQPEFGLKFKETIKTLPRQHIVVFERPKNQALD
jgi:ubiquinone/menaquinone biosynthesis C-methylase UbiE